MGRSEGLLVGAFPQYETPLGSEEPQYQQWAHTNGVGIDPTYDYRGYWQALQAGDPRSAVRLDANGGTRLPDAWHTPLHPEWNTNSIFQHPDHILAGTPATPPSDGTGTVITPPNTSTGAPPVTPTPPAAAATASHPLASQFASFSNAVNPQMEANLNSALSNFAAMRR